MAVQFKELPTGTLKVQSATSDVIYTMKGVNSSMSNATETVTQINKFLSIYGVEVEANDKSTLTITKEGDEE